ncbi:putative urea amidolyase [Saitoella complicata NRRL Y-17804]|uniref:putative urea amidolyase n=1 Tax=Saitoella complicata (strain BCRC 22490 / CBS 7301 / JCM 7358 / NBRC 10748 / NRRL Y-17804) TaxID=698492 RepID=UPI000866A9A4|nr:putative urea amidolyase [Saitoella complicata NRRL Y-17804]ODQ54057.1 putative urea amidolyase [Saitoella complicata NRRL Y-17804]
MGSVTKVLVANRGEIALRCIRSCTSANIPTVAIYTPADAASPHTLLATEKALLPGPNATAYLDIDAIIAICHERGADAVIPGYGFLSENADFARKCEEEGITFIGPSADVMVEFGLKHRARELAIKASVPVVPGTDLLTSEEDALSAAEKLGYPIMLKATGGGGGMGLQVCQSSGDISKAFNLVKSRGATLFKNSGVFLEKYYPDSRHIEVQVFGNGLGDAIAFGERECSIQRRHQKVVEECPSSYVASTHPELRAKLCEAAENLAKSVKYESAGTIEFLVDDATGSFFFLEMNTRLQVEHGITELCYGVDLVELMLRQANLRRSSSSGIPGDELAVMRNWRQGPQGASIEVRLYAENPARDFEPSPGTLQYVSFPEGDGIRVDGWVGTGSVVSPYYDPLLAKIMVHAPTRSEAIEKLVKVLTESKVQGTPTNKDFLAKIVASEPFAEGATLTNFLTTKFTYRPCAIDIKSPGAYTSIQDLPARRGVGNGVPESGPMDSLALRLANIIVGNAPGAECLEVTFNGPELLFYAPAAIAVCGAPMPMTINGKAVGMWERLVVRAGQTLKIGQVSTDGCRAYLAVRGGFPEVPIYLGSKSTSPSVLLGGYQGRTLVAGDYLALDERTYQWAEEVTEFVLPEVCRPRYTNEWEVWCMPGPYDSDDYMTAEDREMIYGTAWTVSHNSNRVGIRIMGPKPKWSRPDGGEGGSHPSNLFDYGYPMGSINWTGDDPVIFAIDAPNLGGLLCSHTVVLGDYWRMGQLKPADTIRFKRTTFENALVLRSRVEEFVEHVAALVNGEKVEPMALDLELPEGYGSSILAEFKADPAQGLDWDIQYRQGGDGFLSVEFGPQTIDVIVRCRIQLLSAEIEKLDGIIFLNPNARSLTVQYDGQVISQSDLLNKMIEIEKSIPETRKAVIPCREIHLPIVFDDPILQEASKRYMETIRPTAAYLPDNIEYLRRSNGFETREEVFQAALSSPFLIAAVGFLAGTPVGFPLLPTSRIVGQKYNPTRSYTPAGTLGLGGSMFAIYPCDAPGGYQLWARTLPCWDPYGTKPGFGPTRPWLFEAFDLVYFHHVERSEYEDAYARYEAGLYEFDIRPTEFDVGKHMEEMAGHEEESKRFKERQRVCAAEIQAEEKALLAKWLEEKASATTASVGSSKDDLEAMLALPGAIPITSPMNANVWKIQVQEGDVVEKDGQVLSILEAMKMEINVSAGAEAVGGVVKMVVVESGTVVKPGDVILVVVKEGFEGEN